LRGLPRNIPRINIATDYCSPIVYSRNSAVIDRYYEKYGAEMNNDVDLAAAFARRYVTSARQVVFFILFVLRVYLSLTRPYCSL